ncbi:MAG: hypothetical protein U9Q81_21070 [Pseudomonadota bacterium]|nr:hypothetical protein [Pseudomonadota bacterium]
MSTMGSHAMNITDPSSIARNLRALFCLLTCLTVADSAIAGNQEPMFGAQPGFSFDCDNTPDRPCRKLAAQAADKSIKIESSSAAWSERYGKVIVVSDNFNDLAEQDAGHYVIAYFGLEDDGGEIPVEPLLSREQVEEFRLYDLEGVALNEDRLYAIGSLALHGRNPKRDRWERHQFLQMDLEEKAGRLHAVNLTHVVSRWPDFRDWLISKSGYEWTGEAIRGRAEGEGINVEALSATSDGNLIIGFRGPLSADGGTLALEIELPPTADDEPVLVKEHVLPPVDFPQIPKGAEKTLRAITMVPGEPGQFYVVLGPKGYEKEELVLARWNAKNGELTEATLLPKDFVAEGVTPIPGGKLLVVDDLKEMILVATEK